MSLLLVAKLYVFPNTTKQIRKNQKREDGVRSEEKAARGCGKSPTPPRIVTVHVVFDDIVILTSLQQDRQRDKVVVSLAASIKHIIGVIAIAPVPSASIVIGINHRKDTHRPWLSQVGCVWHMERRHDFQTHLLTLVASTLVVICHCIIIVDAKRQVFTIVNPRKVTIK